MPLCQIIWLTQSHLPASKHKFLDDTKIKISSKNWYWLRVSQMIWQSRIYYYFYDIHILIFWAQKCWFIKLKLMLGSDVM